eukprot:10490536-Ditylum_brightwellii.AAC.1
MEIGAVMAAAVVAAVVVELKMASVAVLVYQMWIVVFVEKMALFIYMSLLSIGDLSVSNEDVIIAAKKVHIHDTILPFPNGYDTIVGQHGLKLSGGGKQCVVIARAMFKKVPILLCDKPTSSQDSHTEADIMNNLKEIGKNTAILIIVHQKEGKGILVAWKQRRRRMWNQNNCHHNCTVGHALMI